MSDDLEVHFDAAYVYMYKGLTFDPYRGRRLHAIGKAGALAAYQAVGTRAWCHTSRATISVPSSPTIGWDASTSGAFGRSGCSGRT